MSSFGLAPPFPSCLFLLELWAFLRRHWGFVVLRLLNWNVSPSLYNSHPPIQVYSYTEEAISGLKEIRLKRDEN